MSTRDFGDDAVHDYLVASAGGIGSLSDYTLVCFFSPHSTARGASIAVRNAGGNAVQMILDSGKWFYGGDFSAGYNGFAAVADHWTWAAITHVAGSNVCNWHHKDITAGGSIVHGAGGFAVGNPGVITGVRIGDGDNESHAVIALGAVYGSVLSNAALDAIFVNAAAPAYDAGPLAMWLGNATNLEIDITGGGADVTSTVGTVGTGGDPPGFDYSFGKSTIDMIGAGSIGGVSGTGTLKRVVNMSGASAVGGIAGAGTAKRGVELVGASGVGGISGHGSMGEGALAGRRRLSTSSTPRPLVTIGRAGERRSSSVERLA